MYAAHKNENGQIQSVQEHLCETAALCKDFAAAFDAEELAYLIGLCHDIGKYSDAFQKRLLHNGPKVDHTTAGGLEIGKLCGFIGSYCVTGHHGGLPNGGGKNDGADEATLFGKLKRGPKLPDYSAFAKEIVLQRPREPRFKLLSSNVASNTASGIANNAVSYGFTCSMLIRMLFSALVDADFLNTEQFMSNVPVHRGGYDDIARLHQKLMDYLSSFSQPSVAINRKRNEILQNCLSKAAYPKGLFTLTVPTGGGKTLSSLAFALNHAKEHGMNRIIYVVPFSNIIEQNAAIFKKILGADNVLEHHAGFNCDGVRANNNDDMGNKDNIDYVDYIDDSRRYYLASENWDIPIVVTTSVQFFESIFAARTSKCRKNHNIANSVIIFDEAQALPMPYLLPCARVIAELVCNYACSAVLCSATQPALDRYMPKEITATEIADHPKELYAFFKRTVIKPLGMCTDEVLVSRLQSHSQVLCIVNTRRHAQNIFHLLASENCFHLSALMYPEHRKKVLAQIRACLHNGQPCRVVSTSLVEAGVDVDFPVVYRASAGLDSIVQAAGRCNREGKRPAEESFVYVFEPESGYAPPTYMRQPLEITAITAHKFPTDLAAPEAIRDYFERLYAIKGDMLDAKNVVKRLEDGYKKGGSFPFKTIAEDFRLIEDATCAVLIPDTPESEAYAQRFRDGERSRALFRHMGRFCVNVYQQHARALHEVGMIKKIDNDFAILTDLSGYNVITGLTLDPESGKALFVD